MNGVTYVYPDGFMALQEVNLKVAQGERLAILGPNGAGKSTLLMILNGLYTPSSGQVNVLDLPVNEENMTAVRRNVGLVFQDPDDQLFSPTLWEDVCFGPLNMGLPEEEVRTRSSEALEAVGLMGYAQKAPHHLSAGEKKRAAIATVLAMRPKILLLDEPTVNLDPKNRVELANLLRNLHNRGEMTLVTASHDVNFLPEVADRAYVLNKGHVASEGTLREIFSSPGLMGEASLEAPAIARLFSSLSDARGPLLPLTVEEALSELERDACNFGTKHRILTSKKRGRSGVIHDEGGKD
jgi:cobalt/nickel transport system ATP-binding protein